jgi:hypothetical protein
MVSPVRSWGDDAAHHTYLARQVQYAAAPPSQKRVHLDAVLLGKGVHLYCQAMPAYPASKTVLESGA